MHFVRDPVWEQDPRAVHELEGEAEVPMESSQPVVGEDGTAVSSKSDVSQVSDGDESSDAAFRYEADLQEAM